MNFENKVVLVTGASSGIGAAIVQRLAIEKCKLVIVARRIEKLNELKESFRIKENVLALKCDVSNKHEVAEAYNEIINKFGNVDIAILNAGIGHAVTPETYDSRYAEETFGANVLGMIYWIEQLLPEFLKTEKRNYCRCFLSCG